MGPIKEFWETYCNQLSIHCTKFCLYTSAILHIINLNVSQTNLPLKRCCKHLKNPCIFSITPHLALLHGSMFEARGALGLVELWPRRTEAVLHWQSLATHRDVGHIQRWPRKSCRHGGKITIEGHQTSWCKRCCHRRAHIDAPSKDLSHLFFMENLF